MNRHDDKILGHIRRHEQQLLRSVSWISLGIAILYVYGYAWRFWYYYRLGVPVSMIDFPFPETLIPKMPLVIFTVNALFVIAYENYSDFFIKSKRLRRAKAMGIDVPIERVLDYGMQKNLILPDKTNHMVFCEFAAEYMNAKSKDDPEWKFNRSDFNKEVTKQLQDIPHELENAYIDYSLKLLVMDRPELIQTAKDAIGWPAEGFKIYEKIQTVVFWLLVILFMVAILTRSQDAILKVIYMVLGVLVGWYLVKMSKVEARWQMWHSVLIAVMFMLVLNGIDGYLTAGTKLKKNYLPVVKIIKIGGEEYKGLLLGSFNDGYIIAPLEPNNSHAHMKIHKQAVESISWTTVYQMNNEMEKTKKELEILSNRKKDLEKAMAQKVSEKEISKESKTKN